MDAPPDLAALLHRPGPGRHTTSILDEGHEVPVLADLPPLRDRLLFVGVSPSPRSVAAGHYHAGERGARLWARLREAGIIPAGSSALASDDALVAAGHGMTDLVRTPGEATDEALTAGVGALWQKVALWRPAAVVFLHRRAAQTVARRPLAATWGELRGVALAGRPCLLMPGSDVVGGELAAAIGFLGNLSAILPEAFPADPPRRGRP